MLNALSHTDLYRTISKIRAMQGAIFYDRVPGGTTVSTATGTGTSRTSISTSYSVPSASVELLAISPGLSSTADAAADTKMAFADIQGTSFKRQPQQVPAPVGSVTLSVGATRFTPQEWWAVKARVVAGDQYDWGITPLIANTHNMSAWMDLMYANIPSGEPTIYSQIQTTTNAFKTAGSNSAGTLTLTAAAELYEVGTLMSPESATVGNETQIITTVLTCSAMDPVQTFTHGVDPPAQVTATSGDTQVPQITRVLAVGQKFKVPNPQISYTHNLKTAPTNNITTANFARYVALPG